MTVMITEVYDALRSAGAEEEKARRAAEAVAEANREMKTIEGSLKDEMHGIRIEMQAIRGELGTLKWMNGGLLAVAVAIFVRLLFA